VTDIAGTGDGELPAAEARAVTTEIDGTGESLRPAAIATTAEITASEVRSRPGGGALPAAVARAVTDIAGVTAGAEPAAVARAVTEIAGTGGGALPVAAARAVTEITGVAVGAWPAAMATAVGTVISATGLSERPRARAWPDTASDGTDTGATPRPDETGAVIVTFVDEETPL
jgi:hypothetical protein